MPQPLSQLFQPTYSDRVNQIQPSATLEIDNLAKVLQLSGQDVISYAAGEPDFATPDYIVATAIEAARQPVNHKYSPASGLLELREAIAKYTNCVLKSSTTKTSKLDEYNASNIIVTNGGKQAVFEILATLIEDGDEVLLPTPAWLTYQELIEYHGGTTVAVLGEKSLGYKVTVQQLEAHWTSRTKLLLLNSPVNPTGAVYSEAELREIGQFALDKKLWVLTDEIYEKLIYGELLERRLASGFDTAPHLLEVVPELQGQTVVLNGVAKAYAMTGWRVGWLVGPAELIAKVQNLQSHLCSNVNNIAQRAALAAVRNQLVSCCTSGNGDVTKSCGSDAGGEVSCGCGSGAVTKIGGCCAPPDVNVNVTPTCCDHQGGLASEVVANSNCHCAGSEVSCGCGAGAYTNVNVRHANSNQSSEFGNGFVTGFNCHYTPPDVNVNVSTHTVTGSSSVRTEADVTSTVTQMRDAFARRRATILELLERVEGPNGQKFGISHPEGAFYVFVDVSAFLHIPLGADGLVARNATEFAKLLLDQVNVAVVPMDAFGISNHIRFSYALADSKLAEGVRRVSEWLKSCG